jgi:hypothetical protein
MTARSERSPLGLGDHTTLARAWASELHWYEAYGIGKREIRLKRYLD